MTTIHAGDAPTRREREKEAHRREILEAAEIVFSEKGYERTTVEEVARKADFSVGALYNFFENKEILWRDVITKFGADFLEGFRREVLTVPEPMAAISALIEMKMRHWEEHAAFLRVFMEENPGSRVAPAAAIPPHCRALYDEYINEAAGLIKKAMAKGMLHKGDETYVVLSMEGIISSFKAYWARRGMTLSLTEQVRLVERHFLAPLEIQKERSK